MPSWEMMHSVDVSPTSAELAAALERLKWGKAEGGLMFYLNCYFVAVQYWIIDCWC